MLREILHDNLEHLLLMIEKISAAFELIEGQEVEYGDLQEIKRLVHSLKGNLQAIGLTDESDLAKALEEEIFHFLGDKEGQTVFIGKYLVDGWFTRLNEIEFSLKSYLF